jgi:DNA-directed RNA polymerase subunit M/transcription elongation factor TFIIS
LVTSTSVERPGDIAVKPSENIKCEFACVKCKSVLRNIETIRRADGNALQLITCNKCDHKWKELWIHGAGLTQPKEYTRFR